MIPKVAVDSHAAQGTGIFAGEMRRDERDVAGRAHHRMGCVRWALAGPATGVRVDVGDHAELLPFAQIPQGDVARPLEHNDALI